ncbi:DnaJ domain protein, partial [Oesophagostomum dentatum]
LNNSPLSAQEQFKKISIAYSVLSDPNKRRQYDVSGPSSSQLDFEGFDVSELGGVGRVFGALFNKLGVPIPTQIVPKVLAQARQLCEGSACDVEARPIHPGECISASIAKQEGAFYSIEMKEEYREHGICIVCKSSSSSKFKLVLFDKEGGVRMIQVSAALVLSKWVFDHPA